MSNLRTSETNRESRIVPLDGLRGLAATIVFAHHALALLYGPLAGINPEGSIAGPHWIAEALHHLPVAWMFNGAFAVSFFFVLSGFVLTLAVGAAPNPSRVARLVGTRLLRLAPLVFLGTLVGYLLFDLFTTNLNALGVVTGNDSSAYIDPSLLQQHTFGQALKQMTAIIWRGSRAETLFDPPLWSIGVELQGSLLIYMMASVFPSTNKVAMKFLIGTGVGLCLIGLPAIPFLTGMYAAERYRETGNVLQVKPPLLMTFLAAVLTWASVHPWDRHLWLPLPFDPPALVDSAVSSLGSVVLIAAGLQLGSMRRLLHTRLVRVLGEASYGLYVIHVPVLYIGTAPLLRYFQHYTSHGVAILTTAAALLVASVVMGWGLVKYVDTPLARLSKRKMVRWLA